MPCPATAYFNPRSPHGERRDIITAGRDDACDFNPRSPHGERRLYGSHARRLHHFNPRSPARGATHPNVYWLRPPAISIHAPRTGSDGAVVGAIVCSVYFNPRSPHGERPDTRWFHDYIYGFQSTLPRTGSDQGASSRPSTSLSFQSTLPARGATIARAHARKGKISIHAPRTGATPVTQAGLPGRRNFNPRSPARGATTTSCTTYRRTLHFNPRSPHGERLMTSHPSSVASGFQSTLPARGATISGTPYKQTSDISIHAPRTGSDPFQFQLAGMAHISIHAPRTGSDAGRPMTALLLANFNPRSPHGERHDQHWESPESKRISIHSPRTGSDR